MDPIIAYVVGGVLALVGTIISLILITPENKRASLNSFMKFLHDLFNFKFLLIEKLIKFLYILSTIACETVGFFLLFSKIDYFYSSESMALYGTILMIAGPIAVRLVFELMMMGILVVKNVIQINNKLKNQNEDGASDASNQAFGTFDASAYKPAAPAPHFRPAQQYNPVAPAQQYAPTVPTQQYRPAAPAQQNAPVQPGVANQNNQYLSYTPDSSDAPTIPADRT